MVRAWLAVLPCLSVACIWVSGDEYDARLLALTDADSDGVTSVETGGTDCDDGDPAVHPGATETWYDGIDQDCAGDDDYDADGDGRAAAATGGDDCDDGDAGTHPGAAETWYDGVDQDCLGDGDGDADGDGYDAPQAGGEDCDDAEPTRFPPYAEALGDDVDGDCDGGADSFRFEILRIPDLEASVSDQVMGTGRIGPILDQSVNELALAWASEESLADPARETLFYEPIHIARFEVTDIRAGLVADSDLHLGFPSPVGALSLAMDFVDEGAWWVFVSSVYGAGGMDPVRLYVDAFDLTREGHAGLMGEVSDAGFTDLRVGATEEGVYTVAACEAATSTLWLMGSDLSDLTRPAPVFTWYQGTGPSLQRCEVGEGGTTLLGVTEDGGALLEATWSETGVTVGSSSPAGTLLDLEYTTDNDQPALALSDGASGLQVVADGGATFEWAGRAPLEVDVSGSADGTFYLCGVDADGTARVWWGDATMGLVEVPLLDTGVDRVEACSIAAVDRASLVVVTLRGDDRFTVGYVDMP